MSFSLSSELHASIEAQDQALRSRVEASGMYLHEVAEFALVKAAYVEVADRMGVVQDLGSLTTPESRNLVRLVRRQGRDMAVLKLVGNTREPGEGRVLSIWQERGLPSVPPLAWGELNVSVGPESGVVTYLLTGYLPYSTVPPADGKSLNERMSLLKDLMALLAPFHLPPISCRQTCSRSRVPGQTGCTSTCGVLYLVSGNGAQSSRTVGKRSLTRPVWRGDWSCYTVTSVRAMCWTGASTA